MPFLLQDLPRFRLARKLGWLERLLQDKKPLVAQLNLRCACWLSVNLFAIDFSSGDKFFTGRHI